MNGQISADDPTAGLPEDLSHLNIIVVRDPVYSGGGGIEVVANIAKYLDAPIYTLRQTADVEPYRELQVEEIKPDESFLSRSVRKRGLRRLLTLAEVAEYQNWKPPESADIVVTVGTRAQHVIHHSWQKRIHFFFTPARWLWDLSHGQWDGHPRLARWLMLLYASFARTVDVSSTHRFDVTVAGSELVRERVQAYYGLDPEVAYCPVDTFQFHNEESEGYFLMLTRIAPSKRVELVVEAFNELGYPLKIGGTPTGPHEEYAQRCREMANENIEFLGWVEGEEKRQLLARCEALVYAPEREDFGMPPIEAMAAGKPVVGVNEGYTRYQIEDGENGYLFNPELHSLINAVKHSRGQSWDADTIRELSRAYDTRLVHSKWHQVIRNVLE
jgi:glycosyltransferase involved in cell wall biosynthesis